MASDKVEAIKLLLDKYMEGNTSLEEEHLLKEYFSSGKVNSKLEPAVGMFAFFDKCRAESYSYEDSDTGHRITVISEKATAGETNSLKRKPLKHVLYAVVSIAAVLGIVMGVYVLLIVESKPQVYCYINGIPVTDITEAKHQVEFAGQIMDKGIEAANIGIDVMQRTNKYIGSIVSAFTDAENEL